MDDASPLEMPPDEMRRLGYRAVDLLVDRWSRLAEEPAWVGADREETEALFREPPPEEGEAADRVLERAASEVLDRAGRIDHPRFFAFVPSSPTWPSVLGDFLASGFNVFQGTWLESAGPSQVELVVVDWFREWVGMPEGAGGLLTSGGSVANLVGLVTAREAAGNPERPVVYLSDQAHSSLERAARIAGIAPEGVRRVPTGDDLLLRGDALADAVARDREAGRTPLCVCSSAGATNTGLVDPLEELAEVCRREGVWHHVDAAYGGFAVLTDRGREALAGLEAADSVTLDPHKWLFQPYEAGCVLVRDVEVLEDAFRVLPEYLQDTELGRAHVNFANRGVQLTRAFRALKVWMSIRTFGVAAFRDAIDRALDLTEAAGERIRASEELELLSPPSLGVVCFRYRPPGRGGGEAAGGAGDRAADRSDPAGSGDPGALEGINAAIQDRIVEDGFAMMSSTRLRGAYSLRLCILNYRSGRADVLDTLDRIEALGRELAEEGAQA